MAVYVDGPTKTFVGGEAIAKHLAVKLNTSVEGEVLLADAGEPFIGFTEDRDAASGERVTVRLVTAGGTVKATLGGNITVGARVTSGSNGVMVAGGVRSGYVAKQAGGSGDVVELIYQHQDDTT